MLKMRDVRLGVLEVAGDEQIADQIDPFQGVLRSRDDLLPVLAFRLAGVDGDQPAHRGVQIGDEVEDRAIIADEIVLVFEAVDQIDEAGVGFGADRGRRCGCDDRCRSRC